MKFSIFHPFFDFPYILSKFKQDYLFFILIFNLLINCCLALIKVVLYLIFLMLVIAIHEYLLAIEFSRFFKVVSLCILIFIIIVILMRINHRYFKCYLSC